MRQFALSLVLICLAQMAGAFEVEDRESFGVADAAQPLKILSTADIGFFEPMIRSYIQNNPGAAIDYTVASSTELMKAISQERAPFDLVISSAMDLQTKLANDGFAQVHSSSVTQDIPDWAVWNDMVYSFTQEPAAIVVSNAAFEGLSIPRNRQDLISVLRQNAERFRGKVGTYDIRESGLGYLFATQDSRASETYWRLTEVMGRLDAQLYCCSSDMIDAVESGELAVAYNVLGSYAVNRKNEARFTIVLPSDFTTVMLRNVLIPRNAPAPEGAGQFLDHILDQSFLQDNGFAIGRFLMSGGNEASLNRIRLGPGLLVFLDQLKRRAFLSEWESAILQR